MTEDNKKDENEINFEQFRKPWELDDYWYLKKQFLEAYKDKFELDRLLALAQTFINIEVMGNTYDPSVMALIRNLTDDWKSLRQFREEKKSQANEKKKSLVKSQQVENARKRLKTEFNSSSDYQTKNYNNRSFEKRDNRSNNNYNRQNSYTFGSQSVYSPQDKKPYNRYNNRKF